jgi:hypothetical protein
VLAADGAELRVGNEEHVPVVVDAMISSSLVSGKRTPGRIWTMR